MVNNLELGFEQKLWSSADKLRSNMDAAEYKHVVLGLIFLKYISDAFEERYNEIKKDPEYFDGLENEKDAYLEKIFSGFLRKQDGNTCRKMQNSQQLEFWLMIQWTL